MNSPITARFEEDADYLAEAIKVAPETKISHWTIVMLVGFTIVFTYAQYASHQDGWYLFPFVVFGVFAIFLFMRSSRWMLRRQYGKLTGEVSCSVTYEFDEDKIQIHSKNGIKMEFGWHAIARIAMPQSGLLIYIPQKQFRWVPKSSFESEAAFQSVVEIAKAKVVDCKSAI